MPKIVLPQELPELPGSTFANSRNPEVPLPVGLPGLPSFGKNFQSFQQLPGDFREVGKSSEVDLPAFLEMRHYLIGWKCCS